MPQAASLPNPNSVKSATSDGCWTPLHNAAEKGNAGIVALLLQADADVNAGRWPPVWPPGIGPASCKMPSELLEKLVGSGQSVQVATTYNIRRLEGERWRDRPKDRRATTGFAYYTSWGEAEAGAEAQPKRRGLTCLVTSPQPHR
jgi:hypothetical protein